MLAGWGRDHPYIKESLDRLVAGSDDDVVDLVALMAGIHGDPTSARARLLRLGGREGVRRDLLAAGFEACGCDHRDAAVVALLLETSRRAEGVFDPANILFRSFSGSPGVRALALDRIRRPDPPLADIARGYADDPDLAPVLLAAAVPLPLELRTQIVEFAATGAAGTALEEVLANWGLESDAELRARIAIAHFGKPSATQHAEAKAALLKSALQVGPEYRAHRATAFAGLLMIGGLEALAELEDRGNSVKLETGDLFEPIPSLERIICERLYDLQAAFGDGLAERFQAIDHHGRLAEILVRAPDASLGSRQAFLDLAHADALPRTLASLRALAVEMPASRLLFDRCFDALDAGDHHNDRIAMETEIGLILRAEFPGSGEVRDRLTKRFERFRSLRGVAALAVFDPGSPALPTSLDPSEHGREFGAWAPAMHIGARNASAATFVALVEAMINRPMRSRFDAQAIVNAAVVDRLARDGEVADLFASRIDVAANPSTSSSAARYLASAGAFSSDARAKASELISHLARAKRVPIAGYDAVADRWRAARATLLDAIHAGLDLV